MQNETGTKLETVEGLRGLAAVAVAWFHFTNSNTFLSPGLLQASGAYGWLGVEVFFVISGFVIPWAMWRSGYGVVSHDWRSVYSRPR